MAYKNINFPRTKKFALRPVFENIVALLEGCITIFYVIILTFQSCRKESRDNRWKFCLEKWLKNYLNSLRILRVIAQLNFFEITQFNWIKK